MFETGVAVRYVYNSNRLDGVGLGEEQTRDLLEGRVEEGTTELEGPDGKSYDVATVSAHRAALGMVAELARKEVDVTEEIVLDLHKTLMGDMLLAAGEYRECTLRYKGLLIPSPPDTIRARMDALMKLLNNGLVKAEKKDQLAWRIHHEFITIHPFIEANGRMARLLMNLVRLRAGLDVLVVLFDDREKYSKAIVEFQQHKIAKASQPRLPPQG
jgi:Fic family protein